MLNEERAWVLEHEGKKYAFLADDELAAYAEFSKSKTELIGEYHPVMTESKTSRLKLAMDQVTVWAKGLIDEEIYKLEEIDA